MSNNPCYSKSNLKNCCKCGKCCKCACSSQCNASPSSSIPLINDSILNQYSNEDYIFISPITGEVVVPDAHWTLMLPCGVLRLDLFDNFRFINWTFGPIGILTSPYAFRGSLDIYLDNGGGGLRTIGFDGFSSGTSSGYVSTGGQGQGGVAYISGNAVDHFGTTCQITPGSKYQWYV